ncbi:MAG: hypothetical protein ACPGVU_03850, partial [Limisphaerales bacterium]
MQRIVDAVAQELEKPRPLLKQVVDHVSSHFEVSRDELGTFLDERVKDLEDVEIDLLFSAQFTPTLVDQAAFSVLLDEERLPRDQWNDLVNALTERPTVARLVTEDDTTHPVQLTDISIERFAIRLNLDTEIPEALAKLLGSMPPEEDRNLLKAIARRPVFKDADRREILFQYILRVTSEDGYDLDNILSLLELSETYKPKNLQDLLDRIPHWLEVLENEITAAGQPKPFFADRVRELHGGGRDQRQRDDSLIGRKRRNITFLKSLTEVLGEKV